MAEQDLRVEAGGSAPSPPQGGSGLPESLAGWSAG